MYRENYLCEACGIHFNNPDQETEQDLGWCGTTIPRQLLVKDMAEVRETLGHSPTTIEYKRHGEFSVHPYYDRFDGDSWGAVVASALEQYQETV